MSLPAMSGLGRFRPLAWLAGCFLAISALTRLALLVATGWILATSGGPDVLHWPRWLLAFVTAIIVWRTRLHLLWLLGAGAIVGWFGFV